MLDGEISIKDKVRLTIESERRQRLKVHHSATHLVHLALRVVLGDHVKQAGSRVSDQSLRFDFNHYEPISESQLDEIAAIVNREIRENHSVVTEVLPIEDAKQAGAMALFGEKYGDFVRVVQIGPRSKELCGGTHCAASGEIGVLAFTSEGSISSGVRRIEAVAGVCAQNHLFQQSKMLKSVASTLRAGEHDLDDKVQKLVIRNKELERTLESYQQSLNAQKGGELMDNVKVTKDGTKVVTSVLNQASPKQLREMADDLKGRIGSGCIALASVSDGKAIILTAVTDDLVSKFHAGNLVRELSKIAGGKGGGRADMAQAGGGDPTKVEDALRHFQELIS